MGDDKYDLFSKAELVKEVYSLERSVRYLRESLKALQLKVFEIVSSDRDRALRAERARERGENARLIRAVEERNDGRR